MERCMPCKLSLLQPLSPRPEPPPPDLSNIPEVYHDLAAAFSKTEALSLPPHRPYDCAIELLPGARTPLGRLYSMQGCHAGVYYGISCLQDHQALQLSYGSRFFLSVRRMAHSTDVLTIDNQMT